MKLINMIKLHKMNYKIKGSFHNSKKYQINNY